MQKTSFYNGRRHRVRKFLSALLLAFLVLPATQASAQQADYGEKLSGFYAREGNNGSPAKTAGNNIYIKFFDDRWVGMMFIPYPDVTEVESSAIDRVFKAARKQVTSAAILRGKYGLLPEAATITIERYGYLQDRIVFECGALSPCTVKLNDDYLDLIKPGVINDHIIKYDHVAIP
jgi:hypothetical protein